MKDGLLLPYPIDETLILIEERSSIINRSQKHNYIPLVREETPESKKTNFAVNEKNTGDSNTITVSRKNIYPPVLMPPEPEAYLKVGKYDFL